MENNIGQNIRRLREAGKLTQEELGEALGVSFQAVSKWENSVTVPDTMTLPAIAGFFDVTIDELFRLPPDGYENSARKLLAVYEASHDQDDFIRANAEFRKLRERGGFTRDDTRCWGVLYEYHTYHCRDMALKLYGEVLEGEERDEVWYRTQRQRIYFLSKLGRAGECVEEQRREAERDRTDIEARESLIAALYCAGMYAEGLEEFEQAERDFPELGAGFYVYAGDMCRALGRYDEAFAHWERSLEKDGRFIDGLFSKALCLHELGRFGEEAETWEQIIAWFTQRGWPQEAAWPRRMLRSAREALAAR